LRGLVTKRKDFISATEDTEDTERFFTKRKREKEKKRKKKI